MAFDLFVKVNDKYLLYIRQGDGLEEGRLEKLKKFEGQRLYIQKSSINQFKNYVGDLIEETLEISLPKTQESGPQDDARFFETTPAREQKRPQKSASSSSVNVKLSPAMKAVLAQSKEETPEQKLTRQAQVIQSVARTSIDVLNRILEDPDSLVGYQIAAKAGQGIVAALRQSPQMIGELYQHLNDDLQPLVCHSKNVACLSVSLGLRSGLAVNELEELATAGLMHDIGLMKIEQAEDLFTRAKSEMTIEEAGAYDKHGELGHQLSENKNFIPEKVKDLIRLHEENLSGTGPYRQKNLDIGQQILSLVNRFDKIIVEQRLSFKMAFQYLALNEIGNYDLKLIEQLKKAIPANKMDVTPEGWSL